MCYVCCVTLAVFCMMCSVCCLLCAVFCVLCAVCCVLCAVCCVLCAVCCVLCIIFRLSILFAAIYHHTPLTPFLPDTEIMEVVKDPIFVTTDEEEGFLIKAVVNLMQFRLYMCLFVHRLWEMKKEWHGVGGGSKHPTTEAERVTTNTLARART